MNKLLLLPSAKLIPLELQPDFGEIPSGFIPLRSRPAIHYIVEPYAREGFQTVVAVHEHGDLIVEYLCSHPELRATAVDVGPTADLAQTVRTALSLSTAEPDYLVVNFADTLVGDCLTAGDTVCCQERTDDFRWTTFELENGKIANLTEKHCRKVKRRSTLAFVGVFGFSQPGRLSDLLFGPAASSPVDPFYTAIALYFNELPGQRWNLLRVEDWRDFGHLDTYHSTKRTFFMNHRFFNSVAVDTKRGVLRKTSQHSAKLSAEISWYLNLPTELQYLAPRVFDYSLDPSDTFVEMEFYGYPVLADAYMFGEWDLGVWQQVFDALFDTLGRMREHHDDQQSPSERRAALKRMYLDKTTSRLLSVIDDPRFRYLATGTPSINGRRCLGLRECIARLAETLEASGIYTAPPFTIVHGDLCLSNILYDRRNGFIRVIDPRGAFGSTSLYGDPRYDLAKLSHSFRGNYDFFLNGLFHLEQLEDNVICRALLRPKHRDVEDLFANWLAGQFEGNLNQIRLIESLLFLSMVPLHADQPMAQVCFLCRGLELFQSVAGFVGSATGPDEL